MPNQQLITPSIFRIFGAILYDIMIVLGMVFLTGAIAVGVNKAITGNDDITKGLWIFQLSIVLVVYSYYAFFWLKGGQTVGMKAWKLILQPYNDKPLSAQKAAIRLFTSWLSISLFGLGYFWRFTNNNKLTWHDLASQTKIWLIVKS